MLDQLSNLGLYQWTGLITGLIYIGFATMNKPICWVFGIVSCSAIAVEDFTMTRLYADGALQFFYVVVGVYGLYTWKHGGQSKDELHISSLEFRQHSWIIGGGTVLSIAIAWLIGRYSDAAFPFLDSWTTVFSVLATFMLVYKKVENWLYWIVVDAIYVHLYFSREAPLFAVLFTVFTVLAVFGYFHWKKVRN